MASIDYKLIGSRIKEKRVQANYSQEQLAWEAGLSAAYISYIENGVKKASLESLVSICNVLGITMDELLTGNLKFAQNDYSEDINLMMVGTTPTEKRMIYELIGALISILQKNRWVILAEDDSW